MSGAAEAVGLTFTVCTLIVKVFESYEKISDLVGTYRKYSKEVERLNIELSTQKIIFQNECSLLSGAVGVDAKWSMHPDLDKRNNDSCKQLTDLLRLIVETLDLIWEETQRYRREELRDNDSQPNRESFSFRTWVYNVRSKFRFVFEKTALKAKLDSLDHLNLKFIALSRQMSQFKDYQLVLEHQENHELAARGLEEVRRIRTASKGLCKALDSLWLCPDHSEHSANLRLHLDLDESASTPPTPLQFSLVVTSWALDTYDGSKKPVELLVESSLKMIYEMKEDTTSEACELRKLLIASFQGSQLEGVQSLQLSDKTNATEEQGDSTGHSLSKLSDQPGENSSQLFDLCKSSANLCRVFHNEKTSLVRLPGFLVYCNESSRHLARATPLARLLSERNSQRGLNSLEKWKVATSLSMAVLQYHSTPWLQPERWMDNGIMFFEQEPTTKGVGTPESLHLQLLPQTSAASDGDDNSEAISVFNNDPFIKNQTLFQLGMILLELEFEESLDTISNMWNTQLVPETTQECNKNESWAHRLHVPKFHAGEKLGPDYGRIVRMCLDCDFGLGLCDYSLDDDQLQKAFYLKIVCQFRKLLPSWEKIYE